MTSPSRFSHSTATAAQVVQSSFTAQTTTNASVLSWTPPPSAESYRVTFQFDCTNANGATGFSWQLTYQNSSAFLVNAVSPVITRLGNSAVGTSIASLATHAVYKGLEPIMTDNSATPIVIGITVTGTFVGNVTVIIESLPNDI